MLNLDTHVLVHALRGRISSRESALLSAQPWSISAIVLWELAKLNQLGRIELDLDAPGFRRALSRIHVWPLSPEVCIASTKLDFHSDPADEIIAATSIVHRVPLLTRDGRLSGEMALRLEKAFGADMEALMQMQSAYDVARARRRTDSVKVPRFDQKALATIGTGNHL